MVEVASGRRDTAVAERLGEYRGGRFALIASPRGTNEDNYLAQKFARAVMGTNNVDTSSNLRPELVAPLRDLLGQPAATNPSGQPEQSAGFLGGSRPGAELLLEDLDDVAEALPFLADRGVPPNFSLFLEVFVQSPTGENHGGVILVA